jgi:type IV secretion system protein VirD4
MGQRVFILDPFGTVPNHASASFNPLDIIDVETEAGRRLATDNAALLADAIVMPGNEKDPHWDESAKQLITGLILHVATTERPARRNLVRVYELLTRGDEEAAEEFRAAEEDEDERELLGNPLMALLARMEDNEAFGGAISGVATRMSSMGGNERGGVLSTASRNARFLASPPMQDVLKSTSEGLDLAALKSAPEGMTVYLCLPASRMATHQRWLRIMIALSLAAMERERAKPRHPVLFLLDEMPTLGAMDAISTAAGLMAGYGVKLLFVMQDLSQLQRLYERSWETFLGNAGCLQFFGNTDVTTLSHIGQRLGQTKVIEVSESETSGQRGSSQNYQAKVVDLLQPAEARFLFSREKGNQLVLIADELPWALRRVPHYDPFFDGRRDWAEGYGQTPPTLEELRRRPAEEPRKRGWFR